MRLAAAYLRAVALIALLVLPLSAALILLAPEVVRVALGPRWGLAVAPFQILGIGMLFRTSYKMSDSIARSTGAVYRRAWRQVIYAALVVVGAWVGQHWGIAGVAWGALADHLGREQDESGGERKDQQRDEGHEQVGRGQPTRVVLHLRHGGEQHGIEYRADTPARTSAAPTVVPRAAGPRNRPVTTLSPYTAA